MKKNILIVDDDLTLLAYASLMLSQQGFQVLTAESGRTALNVLKDGSVDLILADVGMPDINGYQFFEKVRQNPDWAWIPFIFITARGMDSDVRYGLELGADHYITKPFDIQDLVAIIRSKLLRSEYLFEISRQEVNSQPSMERQVGGLKINRKLRRVWFNAQPVYLSPKEFKLLWCLMEQPGAVVGMRELAQATHETEIMDTLDVSTLVRPLIRLLRDKLENQAGAGGYIKNIRGLGYMVTCPES